jgi:hypothetical protein
VVCDAVALEEHWRRVHEEEQPEHLVQALNEDVLPHLGGDQVLVTTVRLQACRKEIKSTRVSTACVE